MFSQIKKCKHLFSTNFKSHEFPKGGVLQTIRIHIYEKPPFLKLSNFKDFKYVNILF